MPKKKYDTFITEEDTLFISEEPRILKKDEKIFIKNYSRRELEDIYNEYFDDNENVEEISYDL